MSCPCGSNADYAKCCEPFITGKRPAPTAEALMRARYTAYTMARVVFIRESMAPETRKDFDEANARQWAVGSEWLGLKILSSTEEAGSGTVEFVATYRTGGKVIEHHEVAHFRQDAPENRWYFVDGEIQGAEDAESQEPLTPYVRDSPKIGRNDPCSCGSGKKYKKCCGLKAEAEAR